MYLLQDALEDCVMQPFDLSARAEITLFTLYCPDKSLRTEQQSQQRF